MRLSADQIEEDLFVQAVELGVLGVFLSDFQGILMLTVCLSQYLPSTLARAVPFGVAVNKTLLPPVSFGSSDFFRVKLRVIWTTMPTLLLHIY